jgi:hypothetical protein
MEPRKEIIGPCTLYLGTMEETISGIEHIDHILSDPPYLYIKTHDFDKEFDEQLFFENAKHLLPDNGFIALFGRGTSFYRWNTRLADLGFVFKEEIVWDKRYTTAPCIALSRVQGAPTSVSKVPSLFILLFFPILVPVPCFLFRSGNELLTISNASLSIR